MSEQEPDFSRDKALAMAMWYWYDDDKALKNSPIHPHLSRPIATAAEWLNPPIISILHSHFARWTTAQLSPGPVIPQRLWIDQGGAIAFRFASDEPAALPEVGAGEALAQWLVLLSKWMEIHVVLARARTVWSHAELVAALPFTTPPLLPPQLAQFPPNNWEQVARGLAASVSESVTALDTQTE
ncbi:MAG: hypothetical protein OXK78_15385 [Caldilineaceae bacterium]|nr:hypothetical protein [Caldilineaceae bacterium]